ncbi:MAG: MBOAT family O-acyltransferase [Evtepia sp.]|uniref:MBOAT family O-acyltransferase n=1 Tax=Evtepia sp. TaxID=2773933 RepID=UPI002A756740|nr:MBOAT family O-acyltransferase [Evtepia sp.]MDY3015260.1 MBOAT family O-acyltransferase [Evtepia sp.]
MITLSSYFSAGYLGFYLPAAVILYALFPQRGRRALLLLFSYLCFWAVSGKLIAYLILSTLCIHYVGLWLMSLQRDEQDALAQAAREEKKALRAAWQKKQRRVVALGVIFQLGVLVLLKYSGFCAGNINTLLAMLGVQRQITVPQYLLPIGISFYTMQAVSYLFDVYRKKMAADQNLFRLALYMGFFPIIMEGPICRYEQTACQLWEAPALRHQNLCLGLQRICYGIMKKIIVADRLNLFIQNVFNQYETYDGFVIAVAAVSYTIQLYMDFSGTMDLAVGTGQIFGMAIPENFRRPFRSRSISEFWQRWHISLGTWFKDYVFFPLSMSKPLKKLTAKGRKHLGNHFGPLLSGSIALFCVWVGNGLWHGSAWSYLFFGMYHFALILCENIAEPFAAGLAARLGIDRTRWGYRWFQMVRTAVLVCVGELFFRANGLRAGLAMFHKMVTEFSLETLSGGTFFTMGLDWKDWLVVAVMLALVTVVGSLQERSVPVGQKLVESRLWVRVPVYYAMILAVVIFGAYGVGYVPVDPIYAGF